MRSYILIFISLFLMPVLSYKNRDDKAYAQVSSTTNNKDFTCFNDATQFPPQFEEIMDTFYFGERGGADIARIFAESTNLQVELGFCDQQSKWVGDTAISARGCYGLRFRPVASSPSEITLDVRSFANLWKLGKGVLSPVVIVKDLLGENQQRELARLPVCLSEKI